MIMEKQHSRRAALRLFDGASAGHPARCRTGRVLDPVFAAITRHKAAWAAFLETVDPLENVEGEQPGTKEEAAYREANAAADEASKSSSRPRRRPWPGCARPWNMSSKSMAGACPITPAGSLRPCCGRRFSPA